MFFRKLLLSFRGMFNPVFNSKVECNSARKISSDASGALKNPQDRLESDVSFLKKVSVDTFSGDNRYDTELDLAKAYLELCQYDEAKQLLKSVITQGHTAQIVEARRMFAQLLKYERQ